LEKAGACCRRFNNRKIKNLSGTELQADEVQTTVGGKERPIWIFVVVDVWSRLRPTTVIGKRSYRNTLDLFRDLFKRMSPELIPLITTDGFQFYKKVIGRVFGPSVCLRSSDQDAPERSSSQSSRAKSPNWRWTIKPSPTGFGGLSEIEHFVCRAAELTIRQGWAYLGRRTICQAGGKNISKITSSCSAAITILLGLTERSNSGVRLEHRLCRLGWPRGS
jgi:hypothetical protein